MSRPLEDRARRLAKRQGLTLEKSRVRNPDDPRHGGYMLIDRYANAVVAGGSPTAYSLSLDETLAWLAD